MGTLAGDDLERPLELVAENEPCAQLERRLERGWIVLEVASLAGIEGVD